jgi:glycerol-3-phosphate acyltransferase PlsY
MSELLNPAGALALMQRDPALQRANPSAHTYVVASIAALFVILGHMFPVWLKFRGGKGVATGLGAFAVLAPKSILVMIGVFLIIVAVFRYVSLASMLAVAVFPPVAWGLNDYHQTPITLWLMSIASVFIIAKHHANIRRLFSGSEPRFQLRRV